MFCAASFSRRKILFGKGLYDAANTEVLLRVVSKGEPYFQQKKPSGAKLIV